mmetsp:Transcript_27874/g.71077  ORF Transcript_27874/g.71077 Transcript_27874/m.71077 type:complete len:267 (+) Transcript_27874:1835-2635(+)
MSASDASTARCITLYPSRVRVPSPHTSRAVTASASCSTVTVAAAAPTTRCTAAATAPGMPPGTPAAADALLEAVWVTAASREIGSWTRGAGAGPSRVTYSALRLASAVLLGGRDAMWAAMAALGLSTPSAPAPSSQLTQARAREATARCSTPYARSCGAGSTLMSAGASTFLLRAPPAALMAAAAFCAASLAAASSASPVTASAPTAAAAAGGAAAAAAAAAFAQPACCLVTSSLSAKAGVLRMVACCLTACSRDCMFCSSPHHVE